MGTEREGSNYDDCIQTIIVAIITHTVYFLTCLYFLWTIFVFNDSLSCVQNLWTVDNTLSIFFRSQDSGLTNTDGSNNILQRIQNLEQRQNDQDESLQV